MGFFSKIDPTRNIKRIGKAIESPFRTGRSAALREQARSAQNQENQIKGFIDLARPAFEFGTEQLQEFGEFSDPNKLNEVFQGLQSSDLATSLIGERQNAATQFSAARGLRRSGAGIKKAAKVPTEVLLGLLQNIIGTKQNAAQIGLGQGGNVLRGIGGLGGGADAELNAAASNAAVKGSVFSGLLNAGTALFSDSRLKENIENIGETDLGINIYSYNYVGDPRPVVGVMAQEVADVIPEAVIIEGEFMKVDYEAIQ